MDIVRNLAYIVDQVDERTFQARLSTTNAIVSCCLSHELFYRNIQPFVGDLVKLEYNFGLRRSKRRVHNIIEILISKQKEDQEYQLKKKTLKLRKGIETLKRLDHNYDSWTIEQFFGSQWDRILYSSLGIKTIRDLLSVEARTLVREVDGEKFYEMFDNLVKFFKRFFFNYHIQSKNWV